jgi:hypothetical protein
MKNRHKTLRLCTFVIKPSVEIKNRLDRVQNHYYTYIVKRVCISEEHVISNENIII